MSQSEGKPSLNKDFCTEGAGWGGDQNFSLELEYKVRSQNIKWKEHIVLNINKTQPCEKLRAGRMPEHLST